MLPPRGTRPPAASHGPITISNQRSDVDFLGFDSLDNSLSLKSTEEYVLPGAMDENILKNVNIEKPKSVKSDQKVDFKAPG